MIRSLVLFVSVVICELSAYEALFERKEARFNKFTSKLFKFIDYDGHGSASVQGLESRFNSSTFAPNTSLDMNLLDLDKDGKVSQAEFNEYMRKTMELYTDEKAKDMKPLNDDRSRQKEAFRMAFIQQCPNSDADIAWAKYEMCLNNRKTDGNCANLMDCSIVKGNDAPKSPSTSPSPPPEAAVDPVKDAEKKRLTNRLVGDVVGFVFLFGSMGFWIWLIVRISFLTIFVAPVLIINLLLVVLTIAQMIRHSIQLKQLGAFQ